ncbi:DALR anticodon-binding domain-containing protein [Streptomyces sp. NBC_01278]|uniref:ArgS-related anticodon-binding protein NrtL n=1 Tax=Streptomyces sp. NBC_01278 TaxID=2903809 RepID=UPI002E2F537A|nr:DALR anticodon-binding domain-containing protein [Streptomyces sp. NBC_01278]
MIPADLSRTVVRAVRCAVEDGELPARAGVPERVVVERTRPGGVGDYATPVAFQIAKSAGRPPLDVAGVLARRLGAVAGIERVEVTGPGFLNFVMDPVSVDALVREVQARGRRYGFSATASVGIGVSIGSSSSSSASSGSGGLRARVVEEALLRIRATQGTGTGMGTGMGADAAAVAAAAAPHTAPVAKRDGDVVRLYGEDAARWAMLCVAPHESPSFSARLLVQDESSEFFRVRYAHARSRALVRNAARLGFGSGPGEVPDGGPLAQVLADYPLVLEAAAHRAAPEQVVRFLVRAADELLDFHYRVLPKGDEKPSAAHRARLALAEAAGTVLAGGLDLLGIAAPDCL